MNAHDYWTLFLQTGAPEIYLKFKALQSEEKDVFNDPGHRAESYGLQ